MNKRDILGRTTIRNEIMSKVLKVKALLRQQFQIRNSRISFTFDAGMSRAYDHYLTVTAHWIENDWNLHHQIIAFTEIHGEHTGANIGDILIQVFDDYGLLDKDKVSLILCSCSDLLIPF